jgi:uncharacterized protein (TIGR04255 family)
VELPANTNTHGPEWKRAPVVEVVLGIQFEPLPTLTNGHLGWFWGKMQPEFPNSDDAPPLPQLVESVGDEPVFGFPALGFRAATGDSRLRMSSADGSKMIQVQNGWLVVNWTKKDAVYPGFRDVKGLFDSASRQFGEFLNHRNLGVLRPNLWEVTYIDHIPKGTVWESLDDLPKVFPGCFGHGICPDGSKESINSTWTWRLHPIPGRLRVSIQCAKSEWAKATDLLVVRSVARGPIGSENSASIDECLNFGRSSVVNTFFELSSKSAEDYWKGDAP